MTLNIDQFVKYAYSTTGDNYMDKAIKEKIILSP